MSRSDSRAAFSGEKSRNAFRKWGHFFSTIRQFKPALKIALDISSRYPRSSFGGTAFHPGMGTATFFALFMPTFAAVLPPFERSSRPPLSAARAERRRLCLHRKVDRVG